MGSALVIVEKQSRQDDLYAKQSVMHARAELQSSQDFFTSLEARVWMGQTIHNAQEGTISMLSAVCTIRQKRQCHYEARKLLGALTECYALTWTVAVWTSSYFTRQSGQNAYWQQEHQGSVCFWHSARKNPQGLRLFTNTFFDEMKGIVDTH